MIYAFRLDMKVNETTNMAITVYFPYEYASCQIQFVLRYNPFA